MSDDQANKWGTNLVVIGAQPRRNLNFIFSTDHDSANDTKIW
jgi:hypothetical protein